MIGQRVLLDRQLLDDSFTVKQKFHGETLF